MDVVTLSGIQPRLMNKIAVTKGGARLRRFASVRERLQAAINRAPAGTLRRHLLQNELDRRMNIAPPHRGPQLAEYRAYLTERLKNYSNSQGHIHKALQKEIAMIDAGTFRGTTAAPVSGIGKRKRKKGGFFKKLGKGLKKFGQIQKKLALALPRNSALALIGVNFRGMAWKMERADKNKLSKKWTRLGGDPKKLFNTIRKGAKKKPLLGSKTKRAVKGIGEIATDPILINGIGAAPIAAAIAAAAPVIAALLALVKKKPGEKAGVDPDTGEILEPKKTAIESITDMVQDVAAAAGKPTSLPPGESYAVADTEVGAGKDAGLPTGDAEIDDTPAQRTSVGINPMYLALAGAGLFMLMKKK